MTDNTTPRGEREEALAAVLAAIVDLADPADTEPAPALEALAEVIGTARTLLGPYRDTVAAALGEAADRKVADRLYQAELALTIAAEHAATGTAPAPGETDRPPVPRYIGTSAVAARYGVAKNTAYGWTLHYPPTHPVTPIPAPDAYLIEGGRVRGLWIDGEWEAWDVWKRAKDANAFAPRTRGDDPAAASGSEGEAHASA